MPKRRRKRVRFRKPRIKHRVETLRAIGRAGKSPVLSDSTQQQPAPATIYRPWLFPCGSPQNPNCVSAPVAETRPDGKNPGVSTPPINPNLNPPRSIFPGEDQFTPIDPSRSVFPGELPMGGNEFQ